MMASNGVADLALTDTKDLKESLLEVGYRENVLYNERLNLVNELGRRYDALVLEKKKTDKGLKSLEGRYDALVLEKRETDKNLKDFQDQCDVLRQAKRKYVVDYQKLRIEWQRENQKYKDEVVPLKDASDSMERTKFVLVLIDADADMYLFSDEYLKQGMAGGEKAAHAFMAKVRDYLSSLPELVKDSKSIQIMVKAYANLEGLEKVCLTKDRVDRPGDLRRFWIGFTRAFPLIDVVDVGYGKEEADSKIRDVLSFHVKNIQCAHVLLACCHDLGYIPELRKYSSPTTVDRITLLSAGELRTEMQNLGFRTTEIFESLFFTDEPTPLSYTAIVPYAPYEEGSSTGFGSSTLYDNGSSTSSTAIVQRIPSPPADFQRGWGRGRGRGVRGSMRSRASSAHQASATTSAKSWADVVSNNTSSPAEVGSSNSSHTFMTRGSRGGRGRGPRGPMRSRGNHTHQVLPTTPELNRDLVFRLKDLFIRYNLCTKYYLPGGCRDLASCLQIHAPVGMLGDEGIKAIELIDQEREYQNTV